MGRKEEIRESDISIEHTERIERIETADIDNYHGLSLRVVLVFSSLCLLNFAQLQALVGAGALSRNMAATVGGADKIVWPLEIIAIATSVLGPPVSQAADYWGRKWFVLLSMAFGCIGSIIVSRASSMGMVIGGEIVVSMSFGASPLILSVGSEILPRRLRVAAQGVLNMFIGIGGVFALLVGEALVTKSSEGWRTYYYIIAGELGSGALIFGFLYNPPPRPLQLSLSLKEKVKMLDWGGYFLLIAGIVPFCMALSWSENPYSWRSAHVLATFLLGLAFLIALAIHQSIFKRDGMFHQDLFKKDRNFAIATVCLFIEGLAFYSANGYFVFEVSVLFEHSAVLSGLRFCILFFSAAFFSAAIAVFSLKSKRIREPTILAFLLYTLFNVLMATVTLSSSKAVWAYPAFAGAGIGLALSVLVTAAQLSAPPALIAVSTGLVISVRSLGGTVGLAIFEAIFNSGISQHLVPGISSTVLALGLSPKVLPEFIEALSTNNKKALMAIPGVTPQIIGAGAHALQEAYLKSFRYLWVASGAFAVFAAILACFLVNPVKDMSNHVDAPLEDED